MKKERKKARAGRCDLLDDDRDSLAALLCRLSSRPPPVSSLLRAGEAGLPRIRLRCMRASLTRFFRSMSGRKVFFVSYTQRSAAADRVSCLANSGAAQQ